MGINGIVDYLKKKLNCRPKVVKLGEFQGKKIAFDGQPQVYACYKMAVKIHCEDRENLAKNGVNDEEINDLATRLTCRYYLKFVAVGATPIIIYDGDPLVAKEDEIADRNKKKAAYKKQIDEISASPTPDVDELLKAYRGYMTPPRNFVKKVMELLKTLGYPVLRAKNEGEQLASELCAQGHADYVYSVDSDCLMYGPRKWIWWDWRSKEFYEYRMKDILKVLAITHEQFVDLCIMCGCDYNERIFRYAPPAIHADLHKHGSGRKIISYKKRFGVDTSCLKFEECKKLFEEKDVRDIIHEDSINAMVRAYYKFIKEMNAKRGDDEEMNVKRGDISEQVEELSSVLMTTIKIISFSDDVFNHSLLPSEPTYENKEDDGIKIPFWERITS